MTARHEHERPERAARKRRLPAVLSSGPAWWPVPVCAVLGTAAGLLHGLVTDPEYAATAYVVAVPAEGAEPGAALGFAQAYGRIATSDATLGYARVAAGVPASELRDRVTTETSPDSPMIAVTGTSTRPAEAADIANAVADAVSVSSNEASRNTGVRLMQFSRAVDPAEPVSPSLPLGTAVGASAGGLIGGLVLMVRPRRTRPGAAATAVPSPAQPLGAAAERERV
ncbi:YveK family protein [Streptomyces genisteinicus]|uniref:Lipopolysaccharide biosynthesis protein n=1 Tax=Streptomyces genisteinicus TaxID=2768068 RepID=A0A7H0HWU1_9ACTN|nr:lipopolysaccharide biosynthesis protein [Streptomyces genisteinicus]QNP65007.1 lipopolysaccharide biosynthesis protein [Streptomyces genisteinicus]